MEEALRKKINNVDFMISSGSKYIDALLSNEELAQAISDIELRMYHPNNKIKISLGPVSCTNVVILGNYAPGSGHNKIVDILRDISGNFPKSRKRGDYREYKL